MAKIANGCLEQQWLSLENVAGRCSWSVYKGRNTHPRRRPAYRTLRLLTLGVNKKNVKKQAQVKAKAVRCHDVFLPVCELIIGCGQGNAIYAGNARG